MHGNCILSPTGHAVTDQRTRGLVEGKAVDNAAGERALDHVGVAREEAERYRLRAENRAQNQELGGPRTGLLESSPVQVPQRVEGVGVPQHTAPGEQLLAPSLKQLEILVGW